MLTDRERKAIIESHPSTFLGHTHSVDGGRFAKINKETVIGSTPTPSTQYPAGPNWSPDPVGVEPALGIDVNEMEPVGLPHEVNASLNEVHPNALSSLGVAGEGPATSPASAFLPDALAVETLAVPGGQRSGSSLASTTSTLQRRRL